MSAFLVNEELITDKNKIRNMWADHFEALGTLSSNTNYDNNFFNKVTTSVKEIFESCIRDPFGVLSEPLTYEKVVKVCSNLKFGVSGVYVDYEHIRYGGPPLWQLMFELYREFFEQSSASKSLKTGLILPLFKGKGAKANNKDNYRGRTLFPTLCKIYEMILLNRLETYATEKGYFSELQFGFREGVGCIEASFIILETINHMLERGSKVFSCFLDVRKAFDTVWIDGLLYKLFIDLGINGNMWLAIKDLYTDVQAQVLYDRSLSRLLEIVQGTGQGRILAPFMYKVYINGLLRTLSDHCLAISIDTLSLPSGTLFCGRCHTACFVPIFPEALMSICYDYSVTWRYEFNHSKSGIVTFGETKPIHAQSLKEREWFLGNTAVDELSEYKEFGCFKELF